jgi:hypothetical protein
LEPRAEDNEFVQRITSCSNAAQDNNWRVVCEMGRLRIIDLDEQPDHPREDDPDSV